VVIRRLWQISAIWVVFFYGPQGAFFCLD